MNRIMTGMNAECAMQGMGLTLGNVQHAQETLGVTASQRAKQDQNTACFVITQSNTVLSVKQDTSQTMSLVNVMNVSKETSAKESRNVFQIHLFQIAQHTGRHKIGARNVMAT